MQKLTLKANDKAGQLITFCGLDGSGKTSMIQFLTEMLKQSGKEIFLTKQPTPGMRQSAIFRNFMDEKCHAEFDYRALSLMAASDRIQHTNKVIVPELEQGKCVISDRYFYSCLANLRARGYTEDKWIYEIGSHILMPDVSFFMDVPVEVAIERVRQRPDEKERYIDMDLQYRLREEYLSIAQDIGGIVISTEQSEEACRNQVVKTIEEHLGISLGNGDKINEKVREKIYKILWSYSVSANWLDDETNLEDDLGMDSLKRTQFICDIEEKFGFQFDIQDLRPDKFRRVGDVCQLVSAYMNP